MRMLVQQGNQIKELRASQKETSATLKEVSAALKDLAVAQSELARSQKVTETKLQSFIDSLRRGGNGRHSRN